MIKKLLLLLALIPSSVLLGLEINDWRLEIGGRQPERTAQEQAQIKQLWLACKYGKEAEVAQLLIEGVNPKALLHYNDPLDEEDYEDSTCLHYAASGGHLGVVKLLLTAQAEVNARDENGWSPLIGALAHGHQDVVNCLLAKGANVENIDKMYGHRPIATPLQCLHPQLVQRLLNAGAQVIPPLMVYHELHPMHHIHVMPMFINRREAIQQIHQGNALHIIGERLLNRPKYAPEYGQQETEDRALEIIGMVRAHGINMAHLDSEENTAFHKVACTNNRRIVAALLVSLNPSPEIKRASVQRLMTVLLAHQRNGSNMKFPLEDNGFSRLSKEVVLQIFSHMPIECKQAGIECLVVPHFVKSIEMRTRYLDAWLEDPQKYDAYSNEECQLLYKVLSFKNDDKNRAHDLTTDPFLKDLLDPIHYEPKE